VVNASRYQAREYLPDALDGRRSREGAGFRLSRDLAKFVTVSAATESMTVTGTGHLVGTPLYMSPEQLRGQPAAATWDLWALGVVAY
jgi:serine/threonine protein kinase